MDIIHLVLGKANPNRMNGVNKVANSLATSQANLGHDVTIWGITADPTANYPERPYKTKLFHSWKNKFMVSGEMRRAIRAIHQSTVFHIHGGFIPEFFAVTRVLSARKIPYVYLTHGAYNKVAINRSLVKKRIYFELFEKPILRDAKAIQFVGRSEYDALTAKNFLHKKVLIPNGHDLPAGELTAMAGKEHGSLTFGFLGRLTLKEKGLDLLLDGFAAYKRNGGRGRLILVGDGPDRESCEKRVAFHQVKEHVVFTGGKFGEEKDQLIRQMDVMCLTSRNEGLPGAVLEAAAFKIPAIVSPETNMAEYLEQFQAGFALAENNPERITEALHDMEKAGETGRANMGRNARKMVLEAFSWNTIANQLMEVYAK